MKKLKIIVFTLAVLTLGVSTVRAGWFSDGADRISEIQQQLTQSENETGHWQGIAFVLGIGCMVTLITGTIIGSRARRHAKDASK